MFTGMMSQNSNMMPAAMNAMGSFMYALFALVGTALAVSFVFSANINELVVVRLILVVVLLVGLVVLRKNNLLSVLD